MNPLMSTTIVYPGKFFATMRAGKWSLTEMASFMCSQIDITSKVFGANAAAKFRRSRRNLLSGE